MTGPFAGPAFGVPLAPGHRWVLLLLPGRDALLMNAPPDVSFEKIRDLAQLERLSPPTVQQPAPPGTPEWPMRLDVSEVSTEVGPVIVAFGRPESRPSSGWLAWAVRKLGGAPPK